MTEEAGKQTLFISHAHADKGLADVLNQAIEELFGRAVAVKYSSRKDQEGGIRTGANWLEWIHEQVRQSRIAVVLLTPTSIQAPWVLWEAGAVSGAALSTSSPDERKVRPLSLGLERGDVPSPFHALQIRRGDRTEDAQQFFEELVTDVDPQFSGEHLRKAYRSFDKIVDAYVERVETALRNAPLVVTEANVEEWCNRLDALADENRTSEVEHLHDWLDIAFGRDDDDRQRPIDVRIHRRLGQLYLAAKNHERAGDQFELARQLAPRDIFVLRALGQAYLGNNRTEPAGRIISEIETLDKGAFVHNAECAALKGRWHLAQHQAQQARDVYRLASETNPMSYYLADVLGQTELQLGNAEGAKAAYSRALDIISGLSERNIWIHATAATAAIVVGRPDAMDHLTEIRKYGPSEDNLKSIERGLQRVQKSLGLDDAVFDTWLRPSADDPRGGIGGASSRLGRATAVVAHRQPAEGGS